MVVMDKNKESLDDKLVNNGVIDGQSKKKQK
jgi:hypothetical protein